MGYALTVPIGCHGNQPAVSVICEAVLIYEAVFFGFVIRNFHWLAMETASSKCDKAVLYGMLLTNSSHLVGQTKPALKFIRRAVL